MYSCRKRESSAVQVETNPHDCDVNDRIATAHSTVLLAFGSLRILHASVYHEQACDGRCLQLMGLQRPRTDSDEIDEIDDNATPRLKCTPDKATLLFRLGLDTLDYQTMILHSTLTSH